MKKFLSVLLALSVAFTFTFGSTMSAFAAGYTDDELKSLAADAAVGATAAEYTIDYDGAATYTDINNKDMTVFTITAAQAQKSITEAVAKKYTTNTSWASALSLTANDYKVGGDNTNSADLLAVKKAIISDAKSTYGYAAEKDAFDEYQAMLTGLVDSVKTSQYSTTEEAGKTVKNYAGVEYKTAQAAAEADKAYAKAIIANAKYDNTKSTGTPSATEEWTVASYKALYDAVFTTIIKTKGVTTKDALGNAYTESINYLLTKNYTTTADEENAKEDLSYAQTVAKNALSNVVRTYKAGEDYVAKQDAEIAAYVAVKTYLIENNTAVINGKFGFEWSNVAGTVAESYVINKTLADGTTYQDLVAKADKQKAAMNTAKTDAEAYGYKYDTTEAEKQLVKDTVAIYLGVTPTTNYNNYKIENLTAGEKAAKKAYYDEVEAAADGTYDISEVKGISNIGSLSDKYYEAEWTAVKTAIDTYNTAVEAAVTSEDVTTAKKAAAKVIDDILTSTEVNAAVKNDDFITAIKSYFKNTQTEYQLKNTGDIYITWDGATYETSIDTDSVYAWVIAQGSRKSAATYALLPEAKKVVDAYKTAADMQAAAEAVKAQIAALPAAKDVTVADKEAIVAANDALAALPSSAKAYVTNKATLTTVIAAVEKAEATAVATAINALPAANKVTVADKAAVKAAKEALEAYKASFGTKKVYDGLSKSYNPGSPYDFDGTTGALATIKAAEDTAIETAYKALKAKYDNNALTAEDEAAVAELKAAIDAYVAEYKTAPKTSDVEAFTAKIDAVVAAAVAAKKAEEEAAAAAKAEMKAALKIAKITTKVTGTVAKKTAKVKVTAKKNAKAEYYQFKYKKGSGKYTSAKKSLSNTKTFKMSKKGTYTVAVRAVVTMDNGTKVYGAWKTKKVTVK